jgi:hypothetical protein
MPLFYTRSQKVVTARCVGTSGWVLWGLALLLLAQLPGRGCAAAGGGSAGGQTASLAFKVYLGFPVRPKTKVPGITKISSGQLGPSGPQPAAEGPSRKDLWMSICRWNSFASPHRHLNMRIIARNDASTPFALGGELLWTYRPWRSVAVAGAKPTEIVTRDRIATTQLAKHAAVAINISFRTHLPGRYRLVWRRGKIWQIIARVACLYPPAGKHTPATESHWISVMPPLASASAADGLPLQVANLVAHTGIKRYWLLLTTGDPINKRSQLFASALKAAGGRMLLRIIYPITQGNLQQLRYASTSRWLKKALRRLSSVREIEPIFLVHPNHASKYLPLMEKIFASDDAIAHAHHAQVLLPMRWFDVFNRSYQAMTDAVVINATTTTKSPQEVARLAKIRLPIWALPAIQNHLHSNRPAACLLGQPATVVAMAAPWRSLHGGWLIHTLGSAVWLQNVPVSGWGTAALFETADNSVAIICRSHSPGIRAVPGIRQLWLPNRVVGADIFKDMRLRRYDVGSYAQFTDPDGAVSVYGIGGRLLPPLYPGLPRVPATDRQAILISRESAASLLAVLRTASIHLEPRIKSVRFKALGGNSPKAKLVRRKADRAVAPGSRPGTLSEGSDVQEIIVNIQTRSARPQSVQVAAVVGGNQYQLLRPAGISVSHRRRTMTIRLKYVRDCKAVIIVIRGRRRTWLASVPMHVAAKPAAP